MHLHIKFASYKIAWSVIIWASSCMNKVPLDPRLEESWDPVPGTRVTLSERWTGAYQSISLWINGSTSPVTQRKLKHVKSTGRSYETFLCKIKLHLSIFRVTAACLKRPWQLFSIFFLSVAHVKSPLSFIAQGERKAKRKIICVQAG